MGSLSILEKTLQDNKQDPFDFCNILHDPRQSYKMVQDPRRNAMEDSSILNKMVSDSDGLKIQKRWIAPCKILNRIIETIT